MREEKIISFRIVEFAEGAWTLVAVLMTLLTATGLVGVLNQATPFDTWLLYFFLPTLGVFAFAAMCDSIKHLQEKVKTVNRKMDRMARKITWLEEDLKQYESMQASPTSSDEAT